MTGRPPKVASVPGRWPTPYPCLHCGELTNEHVYPDGAAECDECLSERGTPWCVECGREHHGSCADVTIAEALNETVADGAARFLAERDE